MLPSCPWSATRFPEDLKVFESEQGTKMAASVAANSIFRLFG